MLSFDQTLSQGRRGKGLTFLPLLFSLFCIFMFCTATTEALKQPKVKKTSTFSYTSSSFLGPLPPCVLLPLPLPPPPPFSKTLTSVFSFFPLLPFSKLTTGFYQIKEATLLSQNWKIATINFDVGEGRGVSPSSVSSTSY
jgi:hypothetical protein